MYKIHDNLLPLNFVSLFGKNYCIHNYNTRQKGRFHVISHRTKVRERSIKIRGTNLWNSLSTTMKVIARPIYIYIYIYIYIVLF